MTTEFGILHRMRKDAPGKRFFPVSEEAVCQHMKKITKVPEETAARARQAIERMVALA